MIYDNAIRVIMSNIKKNIEILKKETMIDLSNFLFENRYNTYNFGLFKVRKVHIIIFYIYKIDETNITYFCYYY